MKTGHLLFLSGMNREAFNTLSRRGHLDFLKRDVGQGVDRFADQHALAVSVFALFKRISVEPAAAAAAIEESWRDIMRVVGAELEPVKSELCGGRVNNLGINDTWGWEHPNGRGLPPVASATVNLRMAWDWLQPSLAEIRKQPEGTSANEDEEA